MNPLLFLFLAMLVSGAQACKCGVPPLVDNYQKSAFVGTARIIKVTRDPGNRAQEILEINRISAGPVPEEMRLIFMYYFYETGSSDEKSYVGRL